LTSEKLINKYRVATNIMPLMREDAQLKMCVQLNKLFDEWRTTDGGMFIKTDVEDLFREEKGDDN
jgi:hypothetical protein